MLKRLIALIALAGVAFAAAAAFPFGGSDELLEPEKAFRLSVRPLDANTAEVSFVIADGYYLYRDKFAFALAPPDAEKVVKLGAPVFPQGLVKEDKFFGRMETYRNAVAIRLPLERLDPAAQTLQLSVTSQGCADLGVCYVPTEMHAELRLAAYTGGSPALSEGPRIVQPSARISIFASDYDIAELFQTGSFWLVLASFLGFGVLLAFTPCVLPMVPILSGIIVGEGRGLNKLRALTLSLAYVLGMAVTYAAAGIAAAYSGSLLAAALQNAWVLGGFALVFVWLALSMFGFHDLQLPSFLHQRLADVHGRLSGGRIASVTGMGVLSAVIVSPCVAAPLAGALLYISQTRDVMLGGAALFSMALGMGVPLIAVGVSEGALLPKSGPWMKTVKEFFGILMLAVAIWIVSPVVPEAVVIYAWAALLVGGGVFLRAIDRLPAAASGWARLGKALGLMSLVAGLSLIVGALSGSRDPLRPLAGLMAPAGQTIAASGVHFERVGSLGELQQRTAAPGRQVMLDFYADWCVSCKEMEALTFTDPRVKAKLEKMLLLQADVTANTSEHKDLLKRFSLFGPPGIIFFDAQGREIRGLRVIGYQNAERFLKTLELAGGA
ncbi:MAG: protein-disulfide reductase DsbD [Betaproteobacteria bacterium]|nr:protein-disulfide reductase DsbD [Betaproteobacteria bacterium]